MNRITLEEVQEAYKITGAKPKARIPMIRYNKDEIYCCGAGVLAFKYIGDGMRYLGATMEYLTKKYTEQYILGFTNGFDDTDIYYLKDKFENPEFKAGYDDGLAIGKAIFHD